MKLYDDTTGIALYTWYRTRTSIPHKSVYLFMFPGGHAVYKPEKRKLTMSDQPVFSNVLIEATDIEIEYYQLNEQVIEFKDDITKLINFGKHYENLHNRLPR